MGLNSAEVVVRANGSDLHMDYTAVGQSTHLAARMAMTTARIVAVFALAATHDHKVRKLPRIGHQLAQRCRNKIEGGGKP